jgi:hypothetical protein
MYVFMSIDVYTMFWRKNKNTIVSSILQFVTLLYLYLLGPNTFKYLKYIFKKQQYFFKQIYFASKRVLPERLYILSC